MNYQKVAQEILHFLGNETNIDQVTHCSTRLRINVIDFNKVSLPDIKKIAGVVDAVYQAGQVQVVIGPNVAKVYEAFVELLPKVNQTNLSSQPREKKGIFSRLIEFISGSFTPILPVIIGGGLLKGFIAIFVALNLLTTTSQNYKILSLIADASFQFLPVLLAYTAAKKLKANPFIAVTLAGVLLHPTFAAMVNSGHQIALFGLPIKAVNYGSSVIPILLIVYVQSKIEKWLNSIFNDTVAMFATPTISITVNAILGLVVLGPLGGYVGDLLGMAIAFLNSTVPWLAPTILGAFSPLLVMMGMHYSMFPIALQSIAKFGYDSFFTPAGLCANMAQAGAGFAVAVRNKQSKLRSTAVSTSITALLGITEPVLYGVNLKLKKPLYAAIIGGAAGGLYAGLTFVTSTAMASPGILALALFAKTPQNLLNAIIAMIISLVVSFVAGLLIIKADASTGTAVVTNEQTATLTAITAGQVVDLAKVNDETFASGALGTGLAFNSKTGDIFAPVAGKLTLVFPTKHALGITTADGLEILIHLGINTVELNGKYFTNYVEKDSQVFQGQKLAHYDVNAIKQAGYDPIAMMIITNSGKRTLALTAKAGSEILEKQTVFKVTD